MGEFPVPYDFQEAAHLQLQAAAQRPGSPAGHQRQMLMAPTGSGKLLMGLRIIDGALKKGKRALFICDRTVLIEQTRRAAEAYGMETPGILQANHPGLALWRRFQIASAQTIAARGIDDRFDVIVNDEAHTSYAAVTKLLMESKAAVVGLSATPFAKGLGKVYTNLVTASTMSKLIETGVLKRPVTRSCRRPDMDGAKTSGGEWTQKAAEERGMGIIGDVVAEWLRHARDRKTIVFGPTVLHCEELRRQFIAVGVRAELFTGRTPDAERKALLAEYEGPNAAIRVLISVDALAKGFDCPDISCICDCRPLRKSLSTFVQMIGRGLRRSPGLDECMVLDFSGNAVRFKDDFSDLFWNGLKSLDDGERLDKEVREEDEEDGHEGKPCPKCGVTPMGRRCISCGFEVVVKSLQAHEAGESEAFDLVGPGDTAYAQSLVSLYAMIATVCRRRFALTGRGTPRSITWAKFNAITGRSPPRGCEYESAPHVEPSPALLGKLKSMDIAFARSRRQR